MNTIVGLLLGLLKFVFTLGGIALAIWGLLSGNWTPVIWGVVAVVSGQILHLIDRRHHDKHLAMLASYAVAGFGPIPPPNVRMSLMRQALAEVGVGGDSERAFAELCRSWAVEHGGGA